MTAMSVKKLIFWNVFKHLHYKIKNKIKNYEHFSYYSIDFTYNSICGFFTMTYKNFKGTLTPEQANDYQTANWICCGGVFLMMILGFIF